MRSSSADIVGGGEVDERRLFVCCRARESNAEKARIKRVLQTNSRSLQVNARPLVVGGDGGLTKGDGSEADLEAASVRTGPDVAGSSRQKLGSHVHVVKSKA